MGSGRKKAKNNKGSFLAFLKMLFFYILILKLGVFPPEPLYAALGVNQFLLSRIERMAFGANFNRDTSLRGPNGKFIPACAPDGCLTIFWMDSLFH